MSKKYLVFAIILTVVMIASTVWPIPLGEYEFSLNNLLVIPALYCYLRVSPSKEQRTKRILLYFLIGVILRPTIDLIVKSDIQAAIEIACAVIGYVLILLILHFRKN